MPYNVISGGNPNLKPESSKSVSAGLVLTPHWVKRLRLSIDYTRIQKTNEIVSPGNVQAVINNEALYAGRVVRAANLPGDPAGYAGPITLVDASNNNISKSQVQAWDFQMDYTVTTTGLGTFRPYGIATYESEFRQQLLPTSAAFNSAGKYDGPLRWRGNLGLDWTRGPLTLSWNAQYYDGYSLRFGNPASSKASENTRVSNQGGVAWIPSQIYHDLTLRYRREQSRSWFLSNFDLAVGIQNLFDHYPPAIAGSTNGWSPYGDPRLRRYTLSFTKHFGQ